MNRDEESILDSGCLREGHCRNCWHMHLPDRCDEYAGTPSGEKILLPGCRCIAEPGSIVKSGFTAFSFLKTARGKGADSGIRRGQAYGICKSGERHNVMLNNLKYLKLIQKRDFVGFTD